MSGNKLYDVPKFILEHYNMFMDTRMTIRSLGTNNKTLFIYSWIVFTPKEVNTFTPKTVNFYSSYKVFISSKGYHRTYEDASYIRKFEMPLLGYIQGEYYLDEFCEGMVYKKVNEVVDEYMTTGNANVPLIFTTGNKIYSDYYKNNF